MSNCVDLKGATPETWCCIDCGINTAPGFPGRVEMEQRHNAAAVMQKLTRADPAFTTVVEYTFNEFCETSTSCAMRCGRRPVWSRWVAASVSSVLRSALVAG